MTHTEGHTSGRAVDARAFLTPTRIATVAIILVGAVGAILVVAAHGFNGASRGQLVTLAVAILAGVGAQAAPGRSDSGGARTIQVVLWMVAALALVNVTVAWINLDLWAWQAPIYLPSANPIGIDFRAAYAAAQQFSNGPTGWPPLTVVLSVPYLLLGPNAAYVVHVGILIVLNVGALGLAVAVLRGRDGDDLPLCGPDDLHAGLLAPIFAVWLFVSDGFLFSVERGNFDAVPGFFAMLGLWSLVRRPTGVWLPTIAFSVAASIKLYPALLLLLLIWRFRWRSILPLIACNVVLALSAGPDNLVNFLSGIERFMALEYHSASNSSAKSFSAFVGERYPLNLPVSLLIAIPAVLFLFTAWRVWRRRDHAATALMLCGMVPIMFVVPAISNDYKLVLFAGPAVLLAGLLMRHIGRGSAEPWWMLLALLLALFFIATPPDLVWPGILSNKYPWILLLQVVIAWMAWRLPVSVVPASGTSLPAEPEPLPASG